MTKSKALRLLIESRAARPCDHAPCGKPLGLSPRVYYDFRQFHPQCFSATGLKPRVNGAAFVARLIARSRAGWPPLGAGYRSAPL